MLLLHYVLSQQDGTQSVKMAVLCEESHIEIVQRLQFVIFLRAAQTECYKLEIFVEVTVAMRIWNKLTQFEAKLAGHSFKAQIQNLECVCQNGVFAILLTIGLSEEHAQVVGVLDCKFDLLDREIIIEVKFLKSGNFALDLDIFGRFLEI